MTFVTWFLGVLSSALALAIAGGIGWGAARLFRLLTVRRGVLRVTHESGNVWNVKNITRHTLWNFKYSVSEPSGAISTNNGPTSPMFPDMKPGDEFGITLTAGTLVEMWWIDRARREARFEVKDDSKQPIAVIPKPLARRRIGFVSS